MSESANARDDPPGASLSIADRIRRFRESPPMSRDERRSLDLERSRVSTGERERMWWEQSGPATLKYDPDLLGADESIDYSENYPNSRRMQKRGISTASLSFDTGHADTLDDSAYPLGISTVPKPSQLIPTLHRALSSDMSTDRTRSASNTKNGTHTHTHTHEPIRHALRDTTSQDLELEDRYGHLVSKQDGGNRGRNGMDIDLARKRYSGNSSRHTSPQDSFQSAEYSSGGFLSQSAHSDVSILIADNRRSVEAQESNRTSLAYQEASGVGNFPDTRTHMRLGRDSRDWDRGSLDLTSASQEQEPDISQSAVLKADTQKMDLQPFLARVAADVAMDSDLAGKIPASPTREQEEEAYGNFRAFNTFESSLLSRPPPQPPRTRIDVNVTPSGGDTTGREASASAAASGTGTGASITLPHSSQDLDNSDIDLGASFQRLLLGLKQDEERIQRIISGAELDDGKGNMGPATAAGAGPAAPAAAAPVKLASVPVLPLVTGIALNVQTPTKAAAGLSAESGGGTPQSSRPANSVSAPASSRTHVSPRAGASTIPTTPSSQNQIEAGIFAAVAAQQEKTKAAREAEMKTLALYQEQWKMIGESFAQQEKARDGNMTSGTMHMYVGEHTLAADFERLEDRRRAAESKSAIAGAQGVEIPQWEDRGQHKSSSKFKGSRQNSPGSHADDDDFYGERMDLAALTVGAALLRPFDPDALKGDSYRNREALAFEQARGAEIKKKHEDEHAIGSNEGQRWEGLRRYDLFNSHQPPKVAARERADARAKTSVPGMTAPTHRVGAHPLILAEKNIAAGPSPIELTPQTTMAVTTVALPTQQRNSTRYDRSSGPASNISRPAGSKLPADIVRVFQRGKWAEIHHVKDAVAAAYMVSKAAHKFKVFQHGKWQHILHDDSHQFVAAHSDEPTAASPQHRKQFNAVATETVVSSIQTAVAAFLTGTLPGSPMSRSKNSKKNMDPAHAVAASTAMGVLGAGLHNAHMKMQEQQAHVKTTQDLSRPLAASFVSGIFERAASPKRNSGGKALQEFPEIAASETDKPGYKVFMKGQWVVADHHEDNHGISTAKVPIGASVLAKRSAESPSEYVTAVAAEPKAKIRSNVSDDIDALVAIKAQAEIKTAMAFTEAELALQAEIERVRARLGPTYAAAVAAAQEAKYRDVAPSEPVFPSSPGRIHTAVEVSAISGGHVVVPPPLRPFSLAARSEARNWNVYSDDYVNDSNAAYTRWADDADYDNDYDSNNLEKVMAFAPVTTDVAERSQVANAALATVTSPALPTRLSTTVLAQEPTPTMIPSLVTLSAAAVVTPYKPEQISAASSAIPAALQKKVPPPPPQSYFRFLSAPAETAAREQSKQVAEAAAVAAAALAKEQAEAAEVAFRLQRQQQRTAAVNRAYLSTNPSRPVAVSAPIFATFTPQSTVSAGTAKASPTMSVCSPEANVVDKDKFLSNSRKTREMLMRQAGLDL